MNTPEHGDHFLTPEDHRKMVTVWQSQSLKHERKYGEIYRYGVQRREENEIITNILFLGVATIHGKSIYAEIEKRLAARQHGHKIKVLDVGGGAGIYADNLCEKFQDNITVYTTGLRKGNALQYRRTQKIQTPLRKTYLKWRSISELSNYPEFDIIIDTLGEFYYTTGDRQQIIQHLPKDKITPALEQYVYCAIAKLKDGGLLSVAPLSCWLQNHLDLLMSILEDLRKYFPQSHIHYEIRGKNEMLALEIRKQKK